MARKFSKSSTPGYPLPMFHFQVNWGSTGLPFSAATGVTADTGPAEYRDQNNADAPAATKDQPGAEPAKPSPHHPDTPKREL